MLFFYWRIYRAAVRTTRAINQGFRTTKGKLIDYLLCMPQDFLFCHSTSRFKLKYFHDFISHWKVQKLRNWNEIEQLSLMIKNKSREQLNVTIVEQRSWCVFNVLFDFGDFRSIFIAFNFMLAMKSASWKVCVKVGTKSRVSTIQWFWHCCKIHLYKLIRSAFHWTGWRNSTKSPEITWSALKSLTFRGTSPKSFGLYALNPQRFTPRFLFPATFITPYIMLFTY